MSDETTSLDKLVPRVREMLYLDDDSDDQLLNSYVKAATSFIHNAIGEDVNGFYDDSRVVSLVEIAVMSLAGTYYQNRLALSDTQTYPVDLTVNSIIGQLRGIRTTFEEKGDEDNGKK
ncbi:DNA packaging protein [Limosilactobacillus reuteri]|uniref:DNA packaging protein n=1 Tax=Limosilactobacillus reuteri TaxID=1598 RepID=A0A317GKU4_LIMRT|nr:head-tail connector protein [Limosilactobacillus reuteri]MCH5384693.1 head-tail connector protein [Limosilactobacillus reuteri]PWT48595.1 DNA packaging protein [Limosilactobacillus reuteri]PWT53247.1 DNA packaging protein [Limosilactobacillus reuteri]PWT63856.1 DNA packaging protein [Limosilactobacillus reuteri]